MSKQNQMPTSNSELTTMMRVAASVVLHEGIAYLPLLQRLKRDYDEACRRDPSAYARQLLASLSK